MNQSGDAAEEIVRLSLEGFEVVAKITGEGTKDIAVLLYTILKDKQRTAGKTNLTNMLKSGKELKVFSIREGDLKKFSMEAKRYGVLYTALINKKMKSNDGVIDILARSEDAPKIDRIVERFKLSSYDKASIINEIQKTRSEKENNNLNPHLGETEKSPRLKNSSEMQKNLDQGTSLNSKPSVRKKLDKIKTDLNNSKKRERQSKSKNPKTLFKDRVKGRAR